LHCVRLLQDAPSGRIPGTEWRPLIRLNRRRHSLLQPSPSVAIRCNGPSIASKSRAVNAQSPPICHKPYLSLMVQNLIALRRMGKPPRFQDPLPEPTPKGAYIVTGAQPSTVEWRMEP
jgi:hypothetical protein